MNDITVESNPAPSKLVELGIYAWPIWEKPPSHFPWYYEDKETAYILEGEVIVTCDNGESVHIKAGDLVTFAAGLSCHWDIKQDLRKHYRFG